MIVIKTDRLGTVLSRIFVDIPTPRVIYFRPCFYCEQEWVEVPRKFCCNSHRVAYCQKRIALVEING